MEVTYNFGIQLIYRKHDLHPENFRLTGTAHAAISAYKCNQVLHLTY